MKTLPKQLSKLIGLKFDGSSLLPLPLYIGDIIPMLHCDGKIPVSRIVLNKSSYTGRKIWTLVFIYSLVIWSIPGDLPFL